MLTKISYEEQLHDIAESKEKLEHLVGCPITWFRPPHGLYNEETIKVCNQLKLSVVLWNISSWDWKHASDQEKIIENVLTHVSPGDIILLHELPQTLNMLPTLIHGIREKGFHLAKPFTKVI
jgi:peptidoglycan/xylan/chitin deacetylase (PgdA/CDA1 family)